MRLQDELEWQHTRELMAAVLQPHIKKGRKITGKKLIPLSLDEKEKPKTTLTSLKEDILKHNFYHYKWNPDGENILA